ncbi:MAG: hypothetical protein EZS28_039687, partial [Streblomastix strix]
CVYAGIGGISRFCTLLVDVVICLGLSTVCVAVCSTCGIGLLEFCQSLVIAFIFRRGSFVYINGGFVVGKK